MQYITQEVLPQQAPELPAALRPGRRAVHPRAVLEGEQRRQPAAGGCGPLGWSDAWGA